MVLRVRLLGGLAVDGVDPVRLGSRKGRRLFARLALSRGAPVAVDTLVEVVWGDDLPSQPADQLSVLVSRLRSSFGGERLARTAAGYSLRADWLDLAALAELANEARRRLDANALMPAAAAARAALDLVRGPLLPEESEDASWLEAERAALSQHIAVARLVAAEAALAAGDAWTAIALAQAARAAEPFDEAVMAVLLRAHAAAGRPAIALRVYADFAEQLADELGVDPGRRLRELHVELLRTGEPALAAMDSGAGSSPATIGGATGPATAGSTASGSAASGSAASGPTVTGSAASGSTVPGSTVPGSTVPGSAATGPGTRGSAVTGRARTGGAAAVSAVAATVTAATVTAAAGTDTAGTAAGGPPGGLAPASFGAHRHPLAGRGPELAVLAQAAHRAANGAAQLVVVTGEAGIGKTALLREADFGPGCLILSAAADELAGGLALQPLLDAFANHLRARPPEQVDELLAGGAAPLRGLLDPAGAASGSAFAVTLLGADPHHGLSVLLAATDTLVRRLAAPGVLVVVLDDAQWADATTRTWLTQVPRRLADARLCVIAAQRSGDAPSLPATTTIDLGPLDQAGAAEALGLPADSATAQNLYERSGGHPLFLWELSQAPQDALPASVRESVVDRCQRAGAGVATTLRTAAVLGSDVDLELLAAVLDEPVATLLDHLEDGVRRHLLAERPTGIHFAHQLVRDALQADSGPARVALLHRRAAHALAGRPSADPLAIALHARLGGDRPAAATALAQAAELAALRFDLAEAGRLLDEALDLDDRPDLRLRRARLRLRISDTTGCTADTRAVLERVAPQAPQYPAALELEALVAYVERDFDRCVRLAEEGAALAGDPELRASCLALAGRVRHAVGDLGSARELLDRVDREVPASLAPVVDLWRGFLLVHTGEPGPALRLVSREPPQARLGYPFAAINRHMVAGYAHGLRGEPDAALRELSMMSAAAARESTDRFAGRDDNFRGWVLRGVGAFAEADDANTAGYERSRALGLAEPLAHALLDLADGRLRAADPDGAARHLRTLSAEVNEEYLFRWRTDLRSTLLRGRCALAAEDPATALTHFDRVRSEAERLGLPRYVIQARLWAALARHRAGEPVAPRPLSGDIQALETVAPLEAWWLTAEVASTLRVARWRTLARARVARLADRAGQYAETLHAAATTLR